MSLGCTHVFSRKNHPSLHNLHPETERVHIVGHAPTWLLTELIERLPQLKEIELSPSADVSLRNDMRLLLRSRGINTTVRYVLTDRIPNVRTNKGHERTRSLLQELTGPILKRLEYLLSIKYEPAEIFLRYYGLQGYEPTSQAHLVRRYNYPNQQKLSRHIKAVLHFINPAHPVHRAAQRSALQLTKQFKAVQEQKKRERQKNLIDRLVAQLRRETLTKPTAVPIRYLKMLQTIKRANESGRLDKLLISYPRRAEMLLLRFGLHLAHPPVFRSYDMVAAMLGITRQCVQQLTTQALNFLESNP